MAISTTEANNSPIVPDPAVGTKYIAKGPAISHKPVKTVSVTGAKPVGTSSILIKLKAQLKPYV